MLDSHRWYSKTMLGTRLNPRQSMVAFRGSGSRVVSRITIERFRLSSKPAAVAHRRRWLLRQRERQRGCACKPPRIGPAASTSATPAIAAKEGSRCGRSRRRAVEGVEMRTFGEWEVRSDGRVETRFPSARALRAWCRGWLCPASSSPTAPNLGAGSLPLRWNLARQPKRSAGARRTAALSSLITQSSIASLGVSGASEMKENGQ